MWKLSSVILSRFGRIGLGKMIHPLLLFQGNVSLIPVFAFKVVVVTFQTSIGADNPHHSPSWVSGLGLNLNYVGA
ncbi:hypothetical protein ES708_32628 [subsurface metagenome]